MAYHGCWVSLSTCSCSERVYAVIQGANCSVWSGKGNSRLRRIFQLRARANCNWARRDSAGGGNSDNFLKNRHKFQDEDDSTTEQPFHQLTPPPPHGKASQSSSLVTGFRASNPSTLNPPTAGTHFPSTPFPFPVGFNRIPKNSCTKSAAAIPVNSAFVSYAGETSTRSSPTTFSPDFVGIVGLVSEDFIEERRGKEDARDLGESLLLRGLSILLIQGFQL